MCEARATQPTRSGHRHGLPRLRRAAAAPAAAAKRLPRPAAPGRHLDERLRARRRRDERLPRATEGPAARATDDAEANMAHALVQALVDGGLTAEQARAAIRGYASGREA